MQAAPAICPEQPPRPIPARLWDATAAEPNADIAKSLALSLLAAGGKLPAVPIGDAAALCRYRAADQALSAQHAKVRVVFMGDSITEFWAQADPGLFSDARVNRGIAGQYTWQMLVRFRQDVIDLHPKLVHILGGTNDLIGYGGAATVSEIEGNLASMAELAHAHGIAVVLGAVPPMGPPGDTPQRRAEIITLNRWIADYAQHRQCAFADYYAVLVDAKGALDPKESIDSVHPNRAGYSEMESLMGAAVEAMLK